MNKKKRSYKIITIITFFIIQIVISTVLNIDIPWYVSIIVYGMALIISKFLYVYKEGLNILEVRFKRSETTQQFFSAKLQLGASKVIDINGEFDNEICLTETDLRQLIYAKTSREMILPLYQYGEKVVLSYEFKDSIIEVTLF